MDRISDNEIRSLLDKSRREGFIRLVECYREQLYYHIRRLVIIHQDADDALQNTFIKVWENIDRFKWKNSL